MYLYVIIYCNLNTNTMIVIGYFYIIQSISIHIIFPTLIHPVLNSEKQFLYTYFLSKNPQNLAPFVNKSHTCYFLSKNPSMFNNLPNSPQLVFGYLCQNKLT